MYHILVLKVLAVLYRYKLVLFVYKTIGGIILLLGIFALFVSITVIIVLLRMKVCMAISMVSGFIIIAVFARFHFDMIVRIAWESLSNRETVRLIVVTAGITGLGHILKVVGSLDSITFNLKATFFDLRIIIAIIPALVGILVVPGGAIISAPLIEQFGYDINMDKNSLASANIIFRHINSYISPLSSGMILISSITSIDIREFIKFNIPLMILVMPIAFLYIFRGVETIKLNNKGDRIRPVIGLIKHLSPFIIIILSNLILGLSFQLSILLGILYIILFARGKSYSDTTIIGRLHAVITGIKLDMIFALVGIMAFKDMVAASGYLDEISLLLVRMGIPILMLVFIFPFMVGLIIGNTCASIGLTVPIFLPLIPAGASGIPYYCLIYSASVTSYLLSPFHLCLILTIEYFKASFLDVIKKVGVVGFFVTVLSFLRFLIAMY